MIQGPSPLHSLSFAFKAFSGMLGRYGGATAMGIGLFGMSTSWGFPLLVTGAIAYFFGSKILLQLDAEDEARKGLEDDETTGDSPEGP